MTIDIVVGLRGRFLSGNTQGFTLCMVQFHLIVSRPVY